MAYATFPDAKTAARLAREMVELRLAACANIFTPVRSVYRWKGRIEEGLETAALFKTTASRYPVFMEELARRHPYECPCIVAWPILRGWPPFLEWIRDETHPRSAARRETAASKSAWHRSTQSSPQKKLQLVSARKRRQ